MGIKKNIAKLFTSCFMTTFDEPDMSMLEYYQPNRQLDENLTIREMAETAVESLEGLKMQTDCCKREIEFLRGEIRELRREHINRSLNSTDTGFLEEEEDDSLSNRSSASNALWRAEAHMHRKLYEAVEQVARRVPQFLDYADEV